MSPLLLALVAYLGVQFAIGVWVSRRIRDESDYLLGGRKLGYPLALFSIFATWFGAETVVGSAGNAYRGGVSLSNAEPFGYGLCLLLMGWLFAAPLWRRKLTTLADLFRTRYSPAVERLAALTLIPSSILWAAAQIRGFGHVLATASSLEVDTAIGLAAAFVVAYTAFGGLLADAMTDLVQGICLIAGLVVVFVGVASRMGGVGALLSAVAADPGVRWFAGGAEGAHGWALVEEWAIPVCGSVMATELVSRVIAARSPVVARRASLGAGALYLAIGLVPLSLGLVGARLLPGLDDAEQVIPALARDHLPLVFYALFAGALVSAILSTVDSTLLVASGLLSHNLVGPLFKVRDEAAKVRLARAGVAGFGLVAYGLALHAEGVFALVEQASAFGSAGSLVLVLFGLFGRRGGHWTGLATLAAGVLSYVGALALDAPYPFLVSLASSLGTYAVGALVEPGRGRTLEPLAEPAEA